MALVPSVHKKVLLVEGRDDKLVIPELMKANGIDWVTKNNPIVYIEDCEGYENLIKRRLISTQLKESGLSALGIIIDADENPENRWQSIKNACSKSIPDLPESLPDTGLIHLTPNQIKFGIWMMPDNQMSGMLETFLGYMIDDETQELWQFAREVTDRAVEKGAKFKETHRDKANIYSFLAWQNPPGIRFNQAIMKRILNPKAPKAQLFVNWFKTLYDLA